jgi:hypothetical protein
VELGCTKLLSKKSGFSPKSSLKCLPKETVVGTLRSFRVLGGDALAAFQDSSRRAKQVGRQRMNGSALQAVSDVC